MKPPTLRHLILRAYAVGEDSDHEFERLPWSLVQRLVWFGLDNDPNDPDDAPGDGIGVLCLLIGVANWGVKPAPVWQRRGPEEDVMSPIEDPAGDYWRGVRARSGKHFNHGGKRAPYGGLGIAHLDSGALEDAYNAWGWPTHRESLLDKDGDPIAFDTLRRRKGSTWARWVEWATDLVTNPEFAVWSVRYWLKEYWFKAWNAAKLNRTHRGEPEIDIPWIAASACTVARFKNSAKYAADRHLGKAADDVAKAYIQYKRSRRGEDSAERTKRQLGYVDRVPICVRAALQEMPVL